MPTPRPSRQRRLTRAGKVLRLGALLAGCAVLPGFVHAQQSGETAKAYELSDKASNELGKIRPILEADDVKAFPDLIKKIDEIITTLKLTGYDLAYISQLKANLLIRIGEPIKAIKPIEDSLAGDFFPKQAQIGMTLALVQLYMQDAGITDDPKHREARLGQSRKLLEKWFTEVPEPMIGSDKLQTYIDAMSLYANCLYYLKDYKKSYETSKKLVRLSITPTEQSWILLFAAQQESGDMAAAAETFEMFLEKFPNKKDFWLNLTQAYLSSDQTLRAILTYQRAQAKGFMNSPADYLNVFGLYYRLEEFSRASELLRSWIETGKVEDSEDNWELVSVCYQNLGREDAVRKILNEARQRFKTGNLDFMLAQYLWYDGKYKEGMEMADGAWKKGGLRKPGKVAIFLATANCEQRNWERAKMFLEIARKSSDVEPSEIKRVEGFLPKEETETAEAPAEKSS